MSMGSGGAAVIVERFLIPSESELITNRKPDLDWKLGLGVCQLEMNARCDGG
jgi:hypothetical protein